MAHTFRRWRELDYALAAANLRLTDVSRDSTRARHTSLSIQYLTDLRSGRYIYGPNDRVLEELAAALDCTVDELRPVDDDVPKALAS